MSADPDPWTTLLRGVHAWNEMRNTVGSPRIDLSKLHFAAALTDSKTSEDPYDYYFDGLNCADVILEEAILDDGSFMGASFAGADLSYASIARASLRRADLRGATLIGTVFLSTELRDADFSGAEVGDSAFLRVDLNEFRGLEDIRHRFSSMIDVRTLELTAQGLRAQKEEARDVLLRPIVKFLSDCGIPPGFLSLFRTMVMQDHSKPSDARG